MVVGMFYVRCAKCSEPLILRLILAQLWVWRSDIVYGASMLTACHHCNHPIDELPIPTKD